MKQLDQFLIEQLYLSDIDFKYYQNPVQVSHRLLVTDFTYRSNYYNG